MTTHAAAAALTICLIAACDAPDRQVTRIVSRPHPVASLDPEPTNPDPIATPDPVDPVDPVEPDPVDPVDPVEPDPVDPIDPEPEPITTFPFVDSNDTLTGVSEIRNYGCAPSVDESGPEIVYRVRVPETGLLVASLDGLDPGVDVDVHLLRVDHGCLDRGHWDAAARVGAGDYLVVVDTWVSSGVEHAGAFTLTIGFTGIAAREPDGLDRSVLDAALFAFDAAWRAGDTDRLEYTVIDFSLHSMHPRLWTLDLRTGEALFVERATHGEGSAADDPAWAEVFSNVEGSHMSSLGLMRTASRYQSSDNGLSLRLDGLEQGFNDEVRSRAIVIHSDAYASASYVAAHGRMGLSWGCQVVRPDVIEALVDTIEGGALVWSFYPDGVWSAASPYLNGWTEPD